MYIQLYISIFLFLNSMYQPKTNLDYRKYLQQNAIKIMMVNQELYNNRVSIKPPLSSFKF